MSSDTSTTQVLIIGGGPVGLSAAILLADLGIESVLVERRDGSSKLPKAHYLNSRTMEIFDSFGFAEEIYAAGSAPENVSTTTWYTSLGGDGPTDGRIFMEMDAFGGGALAPFYERTSAFPSANLPQKYLEPRLRRVAEERCPGTILFGHECTGLEQHEDGVRATVRSADGEQVIEAAYAIAADGGRTAGAQVGVSLQGLPPFMRATAIHFEADLSPWLLEDTSMLRLVCRPADDGTMLETGLVGMGPTKWDRHSETWVINVVEPLGPGMPQQEWTDDAALAHLRDILKVPDLDAKIISIGGWAVESVLADRYRSGRVFVAGDAAHRHPPTTGLGLNSGVADAHNLAWKLAAVLDDQASDQLLDTYETERRPVAARNIEWAMLTAFNHIATQAGWGVLPGAPPEHNIMTFHAALADTPDGATRLTRLHEFLRTQRLEYQAREIELGYSYYDGGAVVQDGTPAVTPDPAGLDYRQSTRPGDRLPHAMLERDGAPIGTHDLLRPGAHVLITGADGESWRPAATTAAERLGIDIDVVVVDRDVLDPDRSWAAARGHDDDGAVVIRPDGHVVLRVATKPEDPEEDLITGLSSVLRPVAQPTAELA